MSKSKNLIVKDNALINASYNLELIEQRLILLAIAQARKVGDSLSSDRKVVLNVADYVGVYKMKGRSIYENIKNACQTLFERQFTYVEREKKGMRVAKSRWVSEIAYNDERATVDFTFAPSVIPLIHLLEKHFTSYELEQVSDLKSKYSIRMYEILIAWRSQGRTPLITVDEMRYRLGVMEQEYKMISDFKKWTIDLAIKEINEKTDIKVSYEQHKTSRKISGFTFFLQIEKNARQIIPVVPLSDEAFVHEVFACVRMNAITPQQQRVYLNTLTLEKIAATLERANRKADEKLARSTNAVINYGAWYATAFKNDWGHEEMGEQIAKAEKKSKRQQTKQAKEEAGKLQQEQRAVQAALIDRQIKELIAIWKNLNIDQRLHIVHHLQRASIFEMLGKKQFVKWVMQGDNQLAEQIQMIEDERFKSIFAESLPMAQVLISEKIENIATSEPDAIPDAMTKLPENQEVQRDALIVLYHDLPELDKHMVWDLMRENLENSGKASLIKRLNKMLDNGDQPYQSKIFQPFFLDVMKLIV